MLQKPRQFILFSALAAMLAPATANALNCRSSDTERTQLIYSIYLKSGKAPRMRADAIEYHGNTVRIDGTITGLTNYEECWRDKPACDEPAEYRDAPLTVLLSQKEFADNYAARGELTMIDCFTRIGAAGVYKARNR